MTFVPLQIRAQAELELRKRKGRTQTDKNVYQSVWQPNPGPQTDAYHSTAHIIGYGGAAGGGKSDLLLGKAFTQHKKSIIFRNHYTDLGDMVTRGDDILADAA